MRGARVRLLLHSSTAREVPSGLGMTTKVFWTTRHIRCGVSANDPRPPHAIGSDVWHGGTEVHWTDTPYATVCVGSERIGPRPGCRLSLGVVAGNLRMCVRNHMARC